MKVTILNPISYTKHPKYDYVLTHDLRVRVDKYLGSHDFQDEFGRVWVEVRGYTITIKAGYAWDGASMAPDFESVIAASCVHDAGCQFLKVTCFPLSKGEVDGIFLQMMPRKFRLRWIYWGAVRVFGGVYAALSTHDAPASCGLPHGRK